MYSRITYANYIRVFIHVSRRALYDKRVSQEVEGEALGDEFAGYVSLMAPGILLDRF